MRIRQIAVQLTAFAIAALAAGTATPALACYTVYDSGNYVVYRSERPPVDMSRPLHETLPARYPGGSLVFDTDPECAPINALALGNGAPIMSTSSPMLTDERTARAQRLPAKSVERGVAVVPPGAAAMPPSVTVVNPAR